MTFIKQNIKWVLLFSAGALAIFIFVSSGNSPELKQAMRLSEQLAQVFPAGYAPTPDYILEQTNLPPEWIIKTTSYDEDLNWGVAVIENTKTGQIGYINQSGGLLSQNADIWLYPDGSVTTIDGNLIDPNTGAIEGGGQFDFKTGKILEYPPFPENTSNTNTLDNSESFFDDPTQVFQFEEGLERITEQQRQSFIGADPTDPLEAFGGFGASQNTSFANEDYTLENYFGDFNPNQPDYSFDEFLAGRGAQRASFGSEGFIPNDPSFDTTFRVISGTEGFVPDITTFGAEDFIPGDTRFPTEIPPGFAGPAGELTSIGGLGSQIIGGLNTAVNDVLGALGLPGVDIAPILGAAGKILPSVISGNIEGAVSGIVGALGGDIVGTLGGIFGGSGLGGIAGLAGGFLGGGSFVPVKDFTQIALQQQQVTKEYSLDPVAYLAAKTTIRGILASVLNWINTGDNGNPYYITNTADHFRGVDGRTINIFLAEIQRLGLNPNIQRSIALGASPQFSRAIRPTITIGQQNAFMQNFNNGGWDMWLAMIQPNNNPLGQYILSAGELERRRREAELRESQELAWGSGFKPATVCAAKDFLGNCTRTEIVTPGTFIEGQMAGVFSSVIRQLEADDELQEITSSLLSGMISQILGGRTTGLRGFPPSALGSSAGDTTAINRTRAGLQDAIGILLQDELVYGGIKSSALIRLEEAKNSLATLLRPRVYSQSEPLKTRIITNAELASLVSGNQAYATTTINNTVIPLQRGLASDITLSNSSAQKIQTLSSELQNTNTANGFLLISDKYVTLSRQTHSKSDVDTAQKEFETINTLASTEIQGVSSRFAQEDALIKTITDDFLGLNNN